MNTVAAQSQEVLRNLSDRDLKNMLSNIVNQQYATGSATPSQLQRKQQPTNAPSTSQHGLTNGAASTSLQGYNKADATRQRKPVKSASKVSTSTAHYQQPVGVDPIELSTLQYLTNYVEPPVPTIKQAMESSYASRMRTGASTLMQPILQTASALNPRGNSRRTGMVSYAEPGSGDEIDIDHDSEDSDFNTGQRALPRVSSFRNQFASGYGTPMSTGSPAPGVQTPILQQLGKAGLQQTYLGFVPPDGVIVPKLATITRHEYHFQPALDEQASKATNLIPIRVEIETDTHRIRDCFTWNLYEELISPDQFAKVFCADLDLPQSPFADHVAAAIRSQIEEHEGIASLDLIGDSDDQLALPPAEDGLECRVMLAIDVQIANYHLVDTVEWDLLSESSPEVFASSLCSDLGLSGESTPIISHAIHEELLRHKRDAVEWGMIGGDRDDAATITRLSVPPPTGSTRSRSGTPLDLHDRDRTRDKTGLSLFKDKTGLGLNAAGFGGRHGRETMSKGLKRLRGIWRDWSEAEEWGTRLEELTPEEVERREIERERASRRLRRETSKFQTSSTTRRRR